MIPVCSGRSIAHSGARTPIRLLAILLSLVAPHLPAAVPALPNLPGSDLPPALQWQLDEQGASITYEAHTEKWEAKLDHDVDGRATIALEYGLLLNSKLGAGATFRRDRGYSEIVGNAVYAHRSNVRFRLAGAQMRKTEGNAYAADTPSFRQDSYLLSARKYWPAERFVSDLGLAVYTVSAAPSVTSYLSAMPGLPMQDGDEDRPGSITGAKMDGFMLNLGLRPTWDSRIELRREFSHFDYGAGVAQARKEFHSTGRLVYQRFFANCIRFRGGYGAGNDGGRLEVGVANDTWGISLSQDLGSSGSSASLYFSLSLPVDGNIAQQSECTVPGEYGPSFAPVMEAALQRPPQLPSEPIAAIEAN
ncbi:hypothetical protein [Noviherbaspirillum sp. ST9]|uniref:hypothetical protein n=1 Tax=Noviherbaspirillum sp. ST9 TaxID=3401606 RepID=UPI003B58695D